MVRKLDIPGSVNGFITEASERYIATVTDPLVLTCKTGIKDDPFLQLEDHKFGTHQTQIYY